MSEKLFVIKVIESVHRRPCLWDTTHESYGNRKLMDIAWQEVANECGDTVNFCREKWKNVRTGFQRSLRDYPENSVAALPKRKLFYLYDHIKFLIPSILQNESAYKRINRSRNSFSNSLTDNSEIEVFKSEDCAEMLENEFNYLDEFENTVEQKMDFFSVFCPVKVKEEHPEDQSESSEPPDKKFCFDRETSCQFFRETKEEQSLMSFFRGMASDILSLSANNQRFLKRKIIDIVDELHKKKEKRQDST